MRGKPSRTKPPAASGSSSRSRISSTIRSSGTSSPASRIGLRAQAQLGALGDRLAQDLARRDVRVAELGRDPTGLRPFARPLRAEDEDLHRATALYLRKPS